VFHVQNNPKTLNNSTAHWRNVCPSQPCFLSRCCQHASIKTNQKKYI